MHRFSLIFKDYKLAISGENKGNHGFQRKVVSVFEDSGQWQPLQQVGHFNFLGCDVNYETTISIISKLHKYRSMCGTILRTLCNKTKEAKLNFL